MLQAAELGGLKMRDFVVPFSSYPQFRPSTATSADFDLGWRQQALLGNKIAMSVMPLLTDEAIFESFATHETLLRGAGCRLYKRRMGVSLADLAREHESYVAPEAGTQGDLKQQLKRAEYLERAFSASIVEFDGTAMQRSYREQLSERIRLIAKWEHSSFIEHANACVAEILGRPADEVTDFARAERIIRTHALPDAFPKSAYVIYYENGAALMGGATPIVPSQHAEALPFATSNEVIARARQLAHDSALGFVDDSNTAVLLRFSQCEILELARSQTGHNFASLISSLVEDLGHMESDADLVSTIASRLAERWESEKRRRASFSMLKKATDIISNVPVVGSVLGWITMGLTTYNENVTPNAGTTRLWAYIQDVEKLRLKSLEAIALSR